MNDTFLRIIKIYINIIFKINIILVFKLPVLFILFKNTNNYLK